MIGYIAVPLLLVLLQYGTFNPTPLDDLTINLNIKDSLRDFDDNELEADNDDPNVHAVVIGGMSVGAEPLKDVEIFGANEWKPFNPELPTVRSRMPTVSIQNQLYVIGGITSQDKSAPVGLFTERSDTDMKWNNLPELIYKRHSHTATVITTPTGPEIYVTGGWDGTGSMKSMEIYKFAKERWETDPTGRKDLKLQRYEHAAVVFKGQLHVMGGRQKAGVGSQGMKSVEVFQENKWKLLKNSYMTIKRFSHGAVSVNDELFGNIIIVCGGRNKNMIRVTYLNSCEYFNGDKWYGPPDSSIVVSSMNENRAMFGMVVLFGRLWAFGGFNGQEVLTSMESCPVDSTAQRVWTLAPEELYLKKRRMMFGVALYTTPQISNKKELIRKLEFTNAVNRTLV